MQQYSTTYTLGFSAAVCVVCSLLVSASAVLLESRQKENAVLDRQKNVLRTAGLVQPQQAVSREEVADIFKRCIRPVVIELANGQETDIDPLTFDRQAATKKGKVAPQNDCGISRLPVNAVVYEVVRDGKLDSLILPIEGKGLWSTLYGFLALKADGNTIGGISFYQHGETPGLGGEVENPKWQGLWKDRKAFDTQWAPKIEVVKPGRSGPPASDPYHVDGISGSTLTSRGVSRFVRFWLGENGFGPYLKGLRDKGVLKGGH